MKAVVIGLARSGVGAANLLKRRGWDVTVTDLLPASELEPFVSELLPEVKLALGGHPEEGILEDVVLLVPSPGVPIDVKLIRQAIESGIDVRGELELAWRHFEGLDYYAVTGTNGKSTTVTLLNLMMEKAGKNSLLTGNIGNSICAALDAGADYDCVVVEASSFQLDTALTFHPRVAAILNVTPDHMDRYASLEDYRDSKARIAMNQGKGDYLVLNADDPLTASVADEVAGQGIEVFYFSSLRKPVRGMYRCGGAICYDLPLGKGELVKESDIKIRGEHNIQNAMAASVMALLGGCTFEAVREAMAEFSGLEHRLELVREHEGISYINDSKGTNVGAVLKSLSSFDSPLVLIAGGRDKAGDFAQMIEPLKKASARAVVLIGEAAEKIDAVIGDTIKTVKAASIDEAVARARALAREGDVVLLSPACASFDMFESFEHRGQAFKKAVMAL